MKGHNTAEEYYIRGLLCFVSVRKCLGNDAKYWRPLGSDRSGNGCFTAPPERVNSGRSRDVDAMSRSLQAKAKGSKAVFASVSIRFTRVSGMLRQYLD